MTKNMGTADRIIRTLLAVATALILLAGTVSGTMAVIAGALAVVFLLTGASAFCPLYALLRISSRRKDAPVPEHL